MSELYLVTLFIISYLVLKYREDPARPLIGQKPMFYQSLYNNQINARALIGQSAVSYCASKPTEKSRIF